MGYYDEGSLEFGQGGPDLGRTGRLREVCMYGMVNLAIEGLLTERHGQSVWQAIKAKAAPDVDHFLTMEQYPDELTERVIAAALEVSGSSPDALLRDLGEYWVGYARRSGYGELLDIIGNSLPEALDNLDNMHTRVGLAFPDLRPPSFWCTEVTEHSLVLHYHSQRVGLTPMIPGVVKGLGNLFDTEVEVRQLPSGEDQPDHHRFLVTFELKSQG